MRNVTLAASAAACLVFLALAAGCEDGSTGSPGDVPPTPTPDTPAATCAPVTGAGTTHSGDIQGDEVWTAAGSPHIVTNNVTVRSGNKLTIEPCAEVRVAAQKHIQVAFPGTPNKGSLVAEGKPGQPIRFVGLDGARWGSLMVEAPGTARLAYATFEGGGGGDFEHGATLVVNGDGEDGADPLIAVDHVTIERSLGTGVYLARGATFVAGSDALTVHGSGSEEDPYPLDIEVHAIDTLPAGNYTGNKKDEILLVPAGGKTGGSGLLADGTLHDRGLPYHVGRSKQSSLLIGGRTDGKLVTMTIEAGVKMRFTAGSALKVQHFTNEKPSTAAIRALGTAAKPIVLTSASDTPAPGDWQGVWFGGIPDATDKMDHVRIEYAGGDCGCILLTCSMIAQHEGAVIFTAPPASQFITNTAFVNVAGHGITEGYDGTFIDHRPTNTFEGVSGCVQTRPRNPDTSCPTPRPTCD